MISIYTFPIIIVISVIYFLWRRNAAVNTRGAIAGEIDAYLGEDHPEELKNLVYHGFKQSLNGLLPIFAGAAYILSMFSNKEPMLHQLFKRHGKEETKKAVKLLIKTIMVNIVLSPISYLFYFTMIFCSLIIKLCFTALSKNPNRLFKSVITKSESSWIKAVS